MFTLRLPDMFLASTTSFQMSHQYDGTCMSALFATVELWGLLGPVKRLDDCWMHDRSKAVSDIISPHACSNVPAKRKNTIDRNAMSCQHEKSGVYPGIHVDTDALPYL